VFGLPPRPQPHPQEELLQEAGGSAHLLGLIASVGGSASLVVWPVSSLLRPPLLESLQEEHASGHPSYPPPAQRLLHHLLLEGQQLGASTRLKVVIAGAWPCSPCGWTVSLWQQPLLRAHPLPWSLQVHELARRLLQRASAVPRSPQEAPLVVPRVVLGE